jgi:hypothetical protein
VLAGRPLHKMVIVDPGLIPDTRRLLCTPLNEHVAV